MTTFGDPTIDYEADMERRIAELEAENAKLRNDLAKQDKEHCKDCCCARSWAALGITEYTGKSIPEHITLLREALEAWEAADTVTWTPPPRMPQVSCWDNAWDKARRLTEEVLR